VRKLLERARDRLGDIVCERQPHHSPVGQPGGSDGTRGESARG
jgi:hypothetical protein